MYSGGNGTLVNPYLIANITDLKNIESNMSAYFKQTQDITLGTFEPIGYNSGNLAAGTTFTGRYDGDNFTIKDGTINYPTFNQIGLWRNSQGIHVNMKFKNISVIGNQSVGMVIGYSYGVDNPLILNNVHIDNDCDIAGYADYIGGLVGYCRRNTDRTDIAVNACSNKASLVSGTHSMGGIMGYNSGLRIHNCYNEGEIYCLGNNVGGIVGYYANGYLFTTSEIKYCYNSGNISGAHRCGGIVGSKDGRYITNCYALNTSITRTSGTSVNFGRIAGDPQDEYLTNNYAYTDMQFYI